MASVDPTIASLVASATTSEQAWQRLVTTYANKSQARIYGLRENLTHVMKGTKFVAQYLEFKEISAAIRARDHPITYEELYDKLSAHEIFLTHEALKKDAQTISVHHTQHGQQNSNSNSLPQHVSAPPSPSHEFTLAPNVSPSATSSTEDVYQALSSRFPLKDLQPLTYFLGIEVCKIDHGLTLTQTKYITDLLQEFGMMESKSAATPLSSTTVLKLDDGSAATDATQYLHLLGALQYLSLTRLDLAFAVNKLSQFMHKPSMLHWQFAKRILRYLKGTLHSGILLRCDSTLSLHAYADSDWAGNSDDRTSTSAYMVFLGSSPISWCSKKQRTIARSSTKVEYRAIANAAIELNWITNLLQELRISLPKSPVIKCNNLGATYTT
ncbi:hypothetical protein GH714_002048 [Hevea brasiliensis]|uniref:Reverse transcriptase Ty1/copia-type domain-containing protein n=1 Tax=Hevea brasiliensis TaxID=3981 RepID=A0A6A6MWK1_HEVBR|nr:hypothetical protein GH714_002048 [Hevea brasiliensis]